MIAEVSDATDRVVIATCNCPSISIADWISIVIGFVALVVALLNFLKYRELQKENNNLQKSSNNLQEKYNEMVKTQTLSAQGSLETQVRSAISDAYKQVADMAVILQSDPGNEKLQELYKGTEEVYRNAYEDACAKYLDDKIDKERFRTMFLSEIRRLVEEEPHCKAYATNQSMYDCTLKVYNEWFHLERGR